MYQATQPPRQVRKCQTRNLREDRNLMQQVIANVLSCSHYEPDEPQPYPRRKKK